MQFNFNVDILGDIQESIHHAESNDTESVYSSLTSISDKLKKRNKLIKIAGKSEVGQLIIEEYQNDSAASDSDRNSSSRTRSSPKTIKTKSSVCSKPSFSFPQCALSQQFRNANFNHGYTPQLNISFRKVNVTPTQTNTHPHPSNTQNH